MPPELDGFEVHFGVQVSSFGEDGDLIALGHHSPRRTLAAMRSYSRSMFGIDDSPKDPAVIEKRFGTLMTACDPELRNPGHNERTCRACREIREADWWMRVTSVPSRESFPVMHWAA